MDFVQKITSGRLISTPEQIEQAITSCVTQQTDTGNGLVSHHFIEIEFRFGVSAAQPIAELRPGIILCAINGLNEVKFCTLFRASPNEAWQLNDHYLYSSTPEAFMARPPAEQLLLMNWQP